MPQPRLPHLLAPLLLAALLGGCATPPPVHDGPIVLITFDALRADAVGALGGPARLTPHLDALAAAADWAGRGVAASSWTVPSMASLFTGLQPWRHGNWHAGHSVLAPERLTLAEALQAQGYYTAAFRSNHWLSETYGYAQGFDVFRDLGYGRRAVKYLEQLPAGKQFVWIHVLPPHAPYVRYDELLGQLPAVPANLPEKARPLDLEPFYNPAVALPAELRETFWALYLSNVAWADDLLGQLLAALERSGQRANTLLVITADHGEEFGEYGQVAHGGNLGRVLLEVPLLIDLPAGLDRPLALPAGEPPSRRGVATPRVFSTLLAAAGVAAPEGVAPSFFDAAEPEVLSELYLGNGVNELSLLAGDEQLLWQTPFAAPEPRYYDARLSDLGGVLTSPLAETPAAILGRLGERFDRCPPLTGCGLGEPRLRARRWRADGTEEPLPDERARALAGRLKRRWQELNGAEQAPAERAAGAVQPALSQEEADELRALGYAAPSRH